MRHNNKIMHWSDFFSHNEGTNNFLHINGQKINTSTGNYIFGDRTTNLKLRVFKVNKCKHVETNTKLVI